jgi:hypothetical protein
MLGTGDSHLIVTIWQAIGEQVQERLPALMGRDDSLSPRFVIWLPGHKCDDLLDLRLGHVQRHKPFPRLALMVGTKDEFNNDHGHVVDLRD